MEEILGETYDDTLYDGPSDVLSENDGDNNLDNENYSDSGPEIAKNKIDK